MNFGAWPESVVNCVRCVSACSAILINCAPFNSSVLIAPLPATIPPPLGIIMLDMQFLRPLGDVGNPDSWQFPVIIERVSGAFSQAMVSGTFAGIELLSKLGSRLLSAVRVP